MAYSEIDNESGVSIAKAKSPSILSPSSKKVGSISERRIPPCTRGTQLGRDILKENIINYAELTMFLTERMFATVSLKESNKNYFSYIETVVGGYDDSRYSFRDELELSEFVSSGCAPHSGGKKLDFYDVLHEVFIWGKFISVKGYTYIGENQRDIDFIAYVKYIITTNGLKMI